MSAQIIALPRRLFRKIVVEPSLGGWRAHIVGFDPQFYSSTTSREYRTRGEALAAAAAGGRKLGLPVIAVETLTAPTSGPRAA